MQLKLKRPIIFFDLETTGIDIARDRIVEISMVKVMPDGKEIVKTKRITLGLGTITTDRANVNHTGSEFNERTSKMDSNEFLIPLHRNIQLTKIT